MLNVNNTLLAGGNYEGGLDWDKRATSLDKCFKLYHIEKGEAFVSSDNKMYKLTAGNYYLINGFKIGFQCCQVSFKVGWLHFMTDSIFLKQFLHKLPVVTPLSSELFFYHKTVFNSFVQFFKNRLNKQKGRTNEFYSTHLKIQSMLSMIIGNLINELDTELLNPESAEIRLMPAIEFINSSYKKGITLRELASLCFLSENYFHQLFKNAFGTTPNNYILQLRMNEAINLLTNTSMTVKEIAREIGYYDVAYFTRTFSKYFEISPVRFRNSSEKRLP